MFAKAAIVFALILSLLFGAEALPTAPSFAKRDAGSCVAMACLKGCCTSKTCCAAERQQDSRSAPAPSAPRPEFQAAVLDFHIFALLYAVPAEPRCFITLDEESGSHALPPRLASCIQLI